MKYLLIIVSFLIVSNDVIAQKAPSHQQWDKLLKKHVNDAGMVNYKGFKADNAELNAYLKTLSTNAPKSSWSKNDQKAFWINAYNAYTVSLILKHYPVKSIKDIGGKIYKINTPWDIRFINIGGETYDLNNIEHKILRRSFEDPRIHFALVCASISCPKLQQEAYTGDKLEKQLNDAGKEFLNDKSKNRVSANKAELSKYFSWYKGDFTENGSLISFINKYADVKISENAKVSSIDYNWSLNEQK